MVLIGVRIVAGVWGGRILATPRGTGTRPTSDRVRESLFSILDARFPGLLQGASVLDGFAGTGALGLEALSRGATRATFVERDGSTLAVLRRNISAVGATTAEVVRADLFRLASTSNAPGTPYSLLLLDPPYRIERAQVRGLLSDLHESGHLDASAVVAYEHAAGAPAEWPTGIEPVTERTYGDTMISIGAFRGETECK